MSILLILRPQPGAEATRLRATEIGLQTVVAPIFTIVPQAWTPVDVAGHDALMLTSAHAVRQAGEQLGRYRSLPVYAVGEATAAAARAAGLSDIHAGDGDADNLLRRMAADGIRRPIHLAGREHRATSILPVVRLIVYAAEPAATLPAPARAAIADDAIALIHSPRAGALFAALLATAGIAAQQVRIAAISQAAAAGEWRGVMIADRPDDAALLAAAARLCDKG